MRKLSVFAFLAVLLGSGSAYAGTIDFEGMPQSYWYFGGQQNFGTFWQGVNFGPESTILEDQVYGYNSGGYPPHSGHAVLFSISLPYINATFDSPVNDVSFWYSSTSGVYIDAYDSSNGLIGSVFGGPNYGTNSLLQFTSLSSNIKWISVHDSGNFFTIDDFSAPIVTGAPSDPGAVPEPASLTLLGLGLAGMGARRWRQRKA